MKIRIPTGMVTWPDNHGFAPDNLQIRHYTFKWLKLLFSRKLCAATPRELVNQESIETKKVCDNACSNIGSPMCNWKSRQTSKQ